MRLRRRRPTRMQDISQWLRQGAIKPGEAVQMAMDLRRKQAVAEKRPDPQVAEAQRQERIEAVLSDLDELVGLAGVKRHVREIRAYTTIGLRRSEAGLSHEAIGLHMVFRGNPGTGKTTVARILGRLFRHMGLLPQGHMVEVERADLVGEYIGHTAQKTREVVARAMGGVLFIDEAYSLARGGEKDFGKESIDCLVRSMEEHRGKLLMILAGYPAEMDWFLSQNPGLRSRFPITIDFPDYSPEELVAIGERMWRQRQYELQADARAGLQQMVRQGWWWGGEEGNARAMRNLVERSLRCQALRLMGRSGLTREEMMAITWSDLQRAMQDLG